MRSWLQQLSRHLASPQTRGGLHAVLLLIGAAVILSVFLHLNIWFDPPEAPDKLRHFQAGRLIAAGLFFIAYFAIIARVLLVSKTGRSMTRMLLSVPVLLAAALCCSLALAAAVGFAKEMFDMGGFGQVEWLDVTTTLEGAATIVPAVALIMACTPIFIPMDILMQLPRLMAADMRTGIQSIDRYVGISKEHAVAPGQADVLLLEDDIACATTVMHFCRAVGLRCHHVFTVADADAYLRAHLNALRLVILDNFVRADETGRNLTGSDWLKALKEQSFYQQRRFLLVIISGHTSLLGDVGRQADLMLQKPWQPKKLLLFLKQNGCL